MGADISVAEKSPPGRERPKWGGPSGITTVYLCGVVLWHQEDQGQVSQPLGLEPVSPGTPQCSWKARWSWKNREALETGR